MHHAAFVPRACGITHCSPHERIAALSVISLASFAARGRVWNPPLPAAAAIDYAMKRVHQPAWWHRCGEASCWRIIDATKQSLFDDPGAGDGGHRSDEIRPVVRDAPFASGDRQIPCRERLAFLEPQRSFAALCHVSVHGYGGAAQKP